MPELTRVLTVDDFRRRAPTGQLDLSDYLAIMETVRQQGGRGGTVTLGADEQQRTEKRRLSLAAKAQGYNLTWRKSAPGELRFVLAEPGQPSPGSRRRRTPAERPPDEPLTVDAVVAEDPAGVSGTTTTPIGLQTTSEAELTDDGARERKRRPHRGCAWLAGGGAWERVTRRTWGRCSRRRHGSRVAA